MGDSTRDATLRGCEKIGTGTFATAGSPGFSPFRLGASPIFSQPLRTGLDVAPCCSVPPGLKNQRASGDPKHPTRSFLSIKVALHECGQRGRESFSANDQPYGKPLHRKRLPTPSPDSTKKYLAGCLPVKRCGSIPRKLDCCIVAEGFIPAVQQGSNSVGRGGPFLLVHAGSVPKWYDFHRGPLGPIHRTRQFQTPVPKCAQDLFQRRHSCLSDMHGSDR
jgi:hypothetical protein